MSESFEIAVTVDAKAHWVEPPKGNIERIERDYVQRKLRYAAEAAAKALETMFTILAKEE